MNDAVPMELRAALDSDLELISTWLAQPHVARWWHEDAALEVVTKRYAPCLTGSEPTTLLVAYEDERPVGLALTYRWDDYPSERDGYGIAPGTAGLDYLIGHPHDCGRGLGTRLVAELGATLAPYDVWVTPEAANEPSRRVLEKNGFVLMAVKQCQQVSAPTEGPTALYRLQR